MSADVAMTKKGFGEMAITATVAGPIFNVMMGGFLSNLSFLLKSGSGTVINFTAFSEDGSISDEAVLPITIISAQLTVLFVLLFNAIANNFKISFKLSLVGLSVYLSSIAFLCYWCVSRDIQVD